MSELATARGDRLLALALEAPPDELGEALANEALTEEQLIAILRRRDLSGELLRTVAQNTRWIGKYLVKSVVVMNPATPKPIAMNLVKFLFWRDLVKVMNNFALDPPVRVAADKVLRDRLDEMTLGERVALARVGSREIVQALRRVREEPVFQALLTNPRLTEEDLVPIATDPQTPAPILSSIVRHARWNNRYNLRLAVVRNPTTPPAVALSQLITLSEKDLRDLGRHQSVTSAVRSAAVQVLERRSSG